MQIVYIILSVLAGMMAVEVGGYVWHRWAEHHGILGKAVVARHIVHHNKDYPVSKLRNDINKYKSAKSWSWYVLGLLIIIFLYIVAPRPYNYIMIVSGLIYAKFVISYLHSKFHVKNHWLAKNSRFVKIQKLHDIHHWGPYNYGIVFYGLDWIFGTYKDEFPDSKVANFKTDKN